MSDSESQRKVVLREPTVALYKILKFEGLASSGAIAKQLIDEGEVLVNASVERRKRRQIRAGDQITLGAVTLIAVSTEANQQ